MPFKVVKGKKKMADSTPLPGDPGEMFLEENQEAEEHIAAGDLPSAARLLVDIIGKDPSNFRAYNNIGIVSWMRKAWEDAWSMFKKALTIKPDYADALINLFDGALKLRRIAEALPYFDKAVSMNPGLDEIRIIRDSIAEQGDGIYRSERGLIVGVYNPRVDEAQALIAEGKLYLAMEKLLKINDEEGPSADVFSGLGVVSYYQQRYADAFTLFIESIKLNPTSRDNFLNLLDAAKACGRVDEAREIFNLYLKTFPFLSTVAGDFEAVKV
jgi:tetratricopeptide (TPR) repeat protein